MEGGGQSVGGCSATYMGGTVVCFRRFDRPAREEECFLFSLSWTILILILSRLLLRAE